MTYYAPFRDGEIPIRVRSIREYGTNYHANEWDFDKPTDATQEECDIIDAWVQELEGDYDHPDDR